MIYVRIEFDYTYSQKARDMSEEDWADFISRFPELELSKDRTSYFSFDSYFVDLKVVEKLNEYGFNPMVSKIKGLQYLEEISSKNAMSSTIVTQVSVPNNALFEVNEVTWLEDACTQLLQEHLDKGWRILAVCPSNDSRRPDYIIGRRKVNE